MKSIKDDFLGNLGCLSLLPLVLSRGVQVKERGHKQLGNIFQDEIQLWMLVLMCMNLLLFFHSEFER